MTEKKNRSPRGAFYKELDSLNGAAVPIVLIDNVIDPISTRQAILPVLAKLYPMLYRWDIASALHVEKTERFNEAEGVLKKARAGRPAPVNAIALLELIEGVLLEDNEGTPLPSFALVIEMGDRLLDEKNQDYLRMTQMLLNMRSHLSGTQSCIYLLGVQFKVPAELAESVITLTEPLPSKEERVGMTAEAAERYRTLSEAAVKAKDLKKEDVAEITEDNVEEYAEILTGMSPFASEQALARSITVGGINPDRLLAKKRATVNATVGLSVYTGDGRGFSALGGLSNLKEYSTRLLGGKLKPKVILYAEELDKAFAGSGGPGGSDSSGVSQGMLGAWLTFMQDCNVTGILCTGIPGAGKSEYAKRFGEEAGVMTVAYDMGSMKDALVGSSEKNIRQANEVLKNIGGTDGGIVVIATCNRIAQLPPELRRRFTLGTFFFSFPDKEEREVIWGIWMDHYGLIVTKAMQAENWAPTAQVDDAGWTGAEIRNCCQTAHLMSCSLKEAAKYVVPVSQLAKQEIGEMMEQAHSRYLSTSYEGTFDKNRQEETKTSRADNRERKMRMLDKD